MKKRSFIILISVVAAILLLGVASGFIYVTLSTNKRVLKLDLQGDCALEKASCVAQDTVGHQVHIALSPHPITVLSDIQVQAQLQGFDVIQSAKITVEGVNMFMGYQYANLQAVSDNQWQGSFVLPICTSSVMHWRATLAISTQNGRYQADFPFKTYGKKTLPQND